MGGLDLGRADDPGVLAKLGDFDPERPNFGEETGAAVIVRRTGGRGDRDDFPLPHSRRRHAVDAEEVLVDPSKAANATVKLVLKAGTK